MKNLKNNFTSNENLSHSSELRSFAESIDKNAETIQIIDTKPGEVLIVVEKKKPKQRWMFTAKNLSDGKVTIAVDQDSFNTQKEERNNVSIYHACDVEINIGGQQEFLIALGGLFDTYIGENRKHFPTEGKIIFSKINKYKTFKEYTENTSNEGDIYTRFVLGVTQRNENDEVIRYATIGNALRDICKSEGIVLEESVLFSLVADVLFDNHITDPRNIDPDFELILKKDTFRRFLPIFTVVKGNITSDEQFSQLQTKLQSLGVTVTDIDRLKEDTLRWNEGSNSSTMTIYQHTINHNLGENEGKSLSTIKYQAEKESYLKGKESTESEFAYSKIMHAWKEFGETMFTKYSETISEGNRLQIFMNAILDYNVGVRPHRKIKESSDIRIPKNEEYFEQYVNTWKDNLMKKMVVVSEAKEHRESMDFKARAEYVITHGRGGFLDTGERSKKHEKNYAYMKIKTHILPVSDSDSQGRKQYVRETFLSNHNLSDGTQMIGPNIPDQETGYRNDERKDSVNSIGAGYLRQYMPGTWDLYIKQTGKKDARRDSIPDSTEAAMHTLGKEYNLIFKNSDFAALCSRFGIEDEKEKDFLCTIMTINAHNSGPKHMTRALSIMNGTFDELTDFRKEHVQNELKLLTDQHGSFGIFFWLTEKYPKSSKYYQSGIKPKYLIHSPEYAYHILKYFLLEYEKQGGFT